MASNLEAPEDQAKDERSTPSWLKGSQLLALIAAAITTVATVGVTFFTRFIQESTAIPEMRAERRFVEMDSRIESVNKDIVGLKSQINSLSNVPEQTKVAIRLKGIESALTDIQSRNLKLEQVILENPAKAIEVPLLRKDLENLKDAQQQNSLALKQGVDQVYDLNKWLLGAMAVSIVTLAVSNLLRGREKKPE